MPEKDSRRGGRRSTLRGPIIDLLRAHPEGLSAVEIKVYLSVEKHIGDTLSGMVKNRVIRKERSGATVRYYLPCPYRDFSEYVCGFADDTK
jgi:hypothetical protein